MISKTTVGFWRCFDALPPDVQRAAKAKYAIWERDPFRPSLQFKEIYGDLWSVRISSD